MSSLTFSWVIFLLGIFAGFIGTAKGLHILEILMYGTLGFAMGYLGAWLIAHLATKAIGGKIEWK